MRSCAAGYLVSFVPSSSFSVFLALAASARYMYALRHVATPRRFARRMPPSACLRSDRGHALTAVLSVVDTLT
jgi:hypothetical protein